MLEIWKEWLFRQVEFSKDGPIISLALLRNDLVSFPQKVYISSSWIWTDLWLPPAKEWPGSNAIRLPRRGPKRPGSCCVTLLEHSFWLFLSGWFSTEPDCQGVRPSSYRRGHVCMNRATAHPRPFSSHPRPNTRNLKSYLSSWPIKSENIRTRLFYACHYFFFF